MPIEIKIVADTAAQALAEMRKIAGVEIQWKEIADEPVAAGQGDAPVEEKPKRAPKKQAAKVEEKPAEKPAEEADEPKPAEVEEVDYAKLRQDARDKAGALIDAGESGAGLVAKIVRSFKVDKIKDIPDGKVADLIAEFEKAIADFS